MTSGNTLRREGKAMQSEGSYCPCDKKWQPAFVLFSYGRQQGRREALLSALHFSSGQGGRLSTVLEGKVKALVRIA